MNRKPAMKGAGRPKAKKGTMKRVLKFLFKHYRALLCIVLVCLVISALANSISSIFTQEILTYFCPFFSTFLFYGSRAGCPARTRAGFAVFSENRSDRISYFLL